MSAAAPVPAPLPPVLIRLRSCRSNDRSELPVPSNPVPGRDIGVASPGVPPGWGVPYCGGVGATELRPETREMSGWSVIPVSSSYEVCEKMCI